MTDIKCPKCGIENNEAQVLCRRCRHALDIEKARNMGFDENGSFVIPTIVQKEQPKSNGKRATLQDWRDEVNRQGGDR